MAKKKKTSTARKAGIGVGSLAAAVAGAYYLYGTKQGAKKRKKMRSWALKAKGELMEKLEEMEKVNKKVYHEAVDKMAKRYAAMKHIDTKEVEKLAADLKMQWKHIQKEIKKEGKIAAKKAAKEAKKAAKRVKKVAKKAKKVRKPKKKKPAKRKKVIKKKKPARKKVAKKKKPAKKKKKTVKRKKK